jgi:hypothetical protein
MMLAAVKVLLSSIFIPFTSQSSFVHLESYSGTADAVISSRCQRFPLQLVRVKGAEDMRSRYDNNDPVRKNQVDRINEIATKPRAADDGRRVITEAYSAQSSRVVELERILAANDAEVKRLKKFDVKFYAEYDADLKPVGPAYDLLEWQAMLQSQLEIERLHHNKTKAQLAALCAENERLKSVEQHEATCSKSRCLCVFGEADELLRECDHHKALRAELAKSDGARMQGEFLRNHGECTGSWCNDERHTWAPVRWTREAAKKKH